MGLFGYRRTLTLLVLNVFGTGSPNGCRFTQAPANPAEAVALKQERFTAIVGGQACQCNQSRDRRGSSPCEYLLQ